MEKYCRICGKQKDLNDYHKKKDTPDGYRHECKECCKEIQKKYKNEPDYKEKRIEYDKKRYEEKREQILERKKEYHKENRDTILNKKKIYHNKPETKNRMSIYLTKYRNDKKDGLKIWRQNNKELLAKNQQTYRENNPHCVAWRSILYSTLKRLGTEKQGHTIDMLGYSALDLKFHIESLFKDGMTWDNHGEWEIDHILPVTSFSQDTPVCEVCALSNLQPLWMSENRIKSSNIL